MEVKDYSSSSHSVASLDRPLSQLPGVDFVQARLLEEDLGLRQWGDLLHHIPYRYLDKTTVVTSKSLEGGEDALVKGVVISNETKGKKGATRLVLKLRDETGTMELVWFKGIVWPRNNLVPGVQLLAFGKVNRFNSTFSIVHPEVEILVSESTVPVQDYLTPLYNSTERLKNKGLDTKGIAKLIKTLLSSVLKEITETLPPTFRSQLELCSLPQAYAYVHFPPSTALSEDARKRLKFDELFFLQLRLLQLRQRRHDALKGYPLIAIGPNFTNFYENHLPFTLTDAQKRVLKEIRADVKSGHQMNRLLQGDVGSGKTIVALLSMLMAIDNGYQACLMAPTEILAQQHYSSLSKLTSALGLNIKLLTGSTTRPQRQQIELDLAHGTLHIIVGTHALLEDWVAFPSLGMVIVDEQHRFGVAQRARLWEKSKIHPHVLVMTATPIPRTLAMTVYGDLDLSIIDELPPGRREIKTVHRFESSRLRVYGFMKEQIKEGRQIYVVYPLIEESKTLDFSNLMSGFEHISNAFPISEYQIGIVHGRMSAETKEYEMQRFKKGITQILVSTTVIEVGVDVPNASVMIIESAERFGLSQLHQLRGRVGRGPFQSYCRLMTGDKLGFNSRKRIETLVRTSDGFVIADVDLSLRGPGDIAGTQQSGQMDLQIADLSKDGELLRISRTKAQEVIEQDPELNLPQHTLMKAALDKMARTQRNWSRIS